MKEYIDRSLHRPGLDHSRIGQLVIDHTVMEIYAQKMVVPGEMIGEESRDTDDTDSVESDTASVGDAGESSGRTASGILTSDSEMLSPVSSISSVDPGKPPSSSLNRSYGKAKKTKDREPFYKGYGVVYLPGGINRLIKKLHLLATEFFAGNTTVRNELVHELDALL